MKNKQLEFDKGQLSLADGMLHYWQSKYDYIEKAVKYGRCNECNEPLMFDEKDTCEDCLCPE